MRFATYQGMAETTCEPHCYNTDYFQIGIVEEAGEFCGKIKRVFRRDITIDESGILIATELGDALWNIALLAKIRQTNVECLGLNKHLVYPYRPLLSHIIPIALQISTEANLFRIASTRSQLEPLLRQMEKLANAIGYSMHHIAIINRGKLDDRKERGQIQGEGDDR